MSKEMWVADLGNGDYRNPILYTDYSDPDAIRVGDDYFMIASSFCNAPGIPVLHSKDLVNWKVINYVINSIPGERYVDPIHGCGVWAPAIRFHEGLYYACFPMPDEGIFMCTTKDPWGKWSEPINIRPGAGWIDPCPFWDEDGKAYLAAGVAKSRIGYKSVIHLIEMTPDGTSVFGEEVRIFDGNTNDQMTIEGPKMHKRNGWYYIFAPAGGVKQGWQTVLRSKNIWGPYEYKVVLRQGDSSVNGPHQGAWVDTQTGEDWFIHFQDVYAAGRITHLQPMSWENDWPIIGIAKNGNDYGEPVMEYKKPDVGGTFPVTAPDTSDEFDGELLGLQWQWNANFNNVWYELDKTNKQLKLFAVEKESSKAISDVSNLFLQKWPAPEFSCVAKMDFSNLENGDTAGIVSMGITFGALVVTKRNDRFQLETIIGTQNFGNDGLQTVQESKKIADLDTTTVYLQYTVKGTGLKEATDTPTAPSEEISFAYSLDGKDYITVASFHSEAGRWVGVKNGMFSSHNSDIADDLKCGYAVAEYFRYFK